MKKQVRYSEDLADEICQLIADGMTMRAVCRMANMPNRITLLRWMESNDSFATKCARARTLQADAHEEEMAEIEKKTLSGKLDPAAARVVLSSKQWRASKLNPKKYGDRQAIDLAGHLTTSDMTVEEMRAELAQLTGSALPDDAGDAN